MTLTPDRLEAALRRIGAERYHNLHPFHRLLHSGGCSKDQVRRNATAGGTDRKSTRLNSSHANESRMPSSA